MVLYHDDCGVSVRSGHTPVLTVTIGGGRARRDLNLSR
jgi:hypothetical protein